MPSQTSGADSPSSTSPPLPNSPSLTTSPNKPAAILNPRNHSVVTPCLILSGINAWNLWDEHWEHWEHLPPLEERVEYPYQNVRTKNFPWGDGDKTLLYVSLPPGAHCVGADAGDIAGMIR